MFKVMKSLRIEYDTNLFPIQHILVPGFGHLTPADDPVLSPKRIDIVIHFQYSNGYLKEANP